jgi:hypothetical protein
LTFSLVFGAAVSITAQTNILLNSNAESGSNNWRSYGKTGVEEFDGKKVFVIRETDDGGISSFSQTVNLAKSDIGKYALLIGKGSSERLNDDGTISGLPDLYGYMLNEVRPSGGKIDAYLQGQNMLAKPSQPNEWVTMWGIFRVPETTVAIQFFLMQASRKGVPLNGSATRFDDLGLYLFDTQQEALSFAKAQDDRFSN